ncbi:MAG: translation elongation factor Ts [Vicinamibacterales bacterium]|jgi:elongation factor Ts|nr:translation elongation factor Ts [Vicinamibacterales bacterium]
MAITAEMVKALRDRTGAGMMDCKGALTEANGDMDAAIDILRKKGIAKAAKKAERGASDGVIATWLAPDQSAGLLAEINCETDFVARTDDFKALVAFVVEEAVKAGDAATEAWAKDPNGPIQPRVAQLVAKLGENMGVARIVRFANAGIVGNYIHLGGKIGVLVELTGATPEQVQTPAFKTLTKELAMQVAAASPQYARREDVPADVLEREKAVYRGQMEGSGKPAHVVEKIIEGKLGSFYAEVVLPEQASIRDPKVKVSDVIAAAAKDIGATVRVSRFARLKVGEAA